MIRGRRTTGIRERRSMMSIPRGQLGRVRIIRVDGVVLIVRVCAIDGKRGAVFLVLVVKRGPGGGRVG